MKYQKHAETDIDIPLADDKKLHAILRGDFADGRPVAIMMHGCPGHANELLQYLGARYLHERGITTLRLSMYDFGEKYRDLLDCTLDTHVADFEEVVSYVRQQGAHTIFAVGHSYGGLTILASKAKLDGAVLWDPSHGLAWHNDNPEFQNADFPKVTYDDIIVCTGGYGFIASKRQQDNDALLGDTTSMAQNQQYPMKFILAGAGPLAKYARRYYEVASEPKALVEIADAYHQFEDSDEVTEQVFIETAEWILACTK